MVVVCFEKIRIQYKQDGVRLGWDNVYHTNQLEAAAGGLVWADERTLSWSEDTAGSVWRLISW